MFASGDGGRARKPDVSNSTSESARSLPRSLFVLFPVVLMDMIGFGFIIPLLPDYATQFGATPALIGLLTASYAFGQFLAAPLIGRLSDRFGRKPLLLVSVAGTCGALLLIGSAWSLPLLFAARLFDGLTGASATVAQSYVADVTTTQQRARALGLIGAAFGLGFIFGPLFGGVLVAFGYGVPAFVAAGIAVVNFIVVATLLPESAPGARRGAAEKQTTDSSGKQGVLAAAIAALRTPRLGPVLRILAIYSLAFTLFELTFSLFALEALELGPRVRSFLLAYIGFIVAVMQGVVIGPLTQNVGERRLVFISAVLLSVSLVLFAFSRSTLYLAIVLLPLSATAGLMQPLLRSLLSQSVDPAEIGSSFGVATSFDSLNRMIAPALGGALIGTVGSWGPGLVGGVLCAVTAVMIARLFRPFARSKNEKWSEAW